MSESTKRRIRRSREEWQRLIDEQAGSGLTQGAFCREHSLSVASFQNWKRRLATEDTVVEPWLELGALAKAQAAGWEIELDLGDGLCLRLRRC